ncbi:MAG: dTMP kinase [Synergistaceae bacterium]|jgi:dTMP kinase|nr:dTMP kinase [Synergistaceae bacterium]
MFIVFEGIDGCGKTTQARRLSEWVGEKLGAGGVTLTHEPGGWLGGERVRDFILKGGISTRWGEFFAFMMDRCEHVERVIAPALARNRCVLCDRYVASTLAYQVFSDPETPEETAEYVARLHDVIGLPRPDCVCLLDLEPDIARVRLAARGKSNAFDYRVDDFFSRVRDGYDKIMRLSPDSWIKIDASRSEDEVFGDLTAELETRFPSLLERNPA